MSLIEKYQDLKNEILEKNKEKISRHISYLNWANDDLEHLEGFRYDYEIRIEKLKRKIKKMESRKEKCLTILQMTK